MTNPGGRPTKYKPEYCQQLIDLMATGHSFESFAGYARVAVKTLYDWKDAHPEFLQAQKTGLGLCRHFWESKGIEHLVETKDGPRINTGLWIANMKNRFGWRDKVELSGDEDNPVRISAKIDVAKLSTEELLKGINDELNG